MNVALGRALLVAFGVAACSTQRSAASGPSPGASASAAPHATASRDAEAAEPDAAPPPSPAVVAEEEPEPRFDEIVSVLFADRASHASVLSACPESVPPEARIRCLVDERYRPDAKAASLAHELWVKWKIVAGVEVAHTMDGGFRGSIRLEPAPPVGQDKKHLVWIVAAMRDFDAFFLELDRYGKERGGRGLRGAAGQPKSYRFRPLMLRFMRSVGRTTPSAYAHDWTIAWNVAGSLHTSEDAVRETLFHEIFHLNDFAHATWSPGALHALYDPILAKCGVKAPCLKPYTPNETMVRGGTYYSFQQGNGDSVMEYAAELALRYYREQRAVLRGLPKVQPFKCGPAENARAWALMRDEFFGGVDAVPPCP